MADRLSDAEVVLRINDSQLNSQLRALSLNIGAKLAAVTNRIESVLDRKIGALQKKFSGMSLSGLGMTAAVAAGNLLSVGITRAASAAQDLVTRGFMANAQFDNLNNTFTVMLGSQQKAATLMKDITKFAAATPFEIGDLAQNTAALLATRQVGEKEVLPMLKKLGDAAAGSTDGFASMPRVVRAISQMLSKGKLQAEEMMQLAEAGIPAWGALADKMGLSTAQVQELGQKGKLGIKEIMLLVDGLGEKYAGLAAKQSKTFAGLSSTISDNITIALAKATRPIYDRITGIMAKLVEVMDSPAFQAMIDSVTEKVAVAIKWIDKLIDRAIEFATSPVGKAAIQFAAIAASVATAVVGMTALSAAAAFAAPFAGTIAIIAAKIALISAGLAAFSALLRNAFSGPMGAQFTAQLERIWSLIRAISENVAGGLVSAFNAASDALLRFFGQSGGLQAGFNSVIESSLSWAEKLLGYASTLSSDWGKAWEYIRLSGEGAVRYVIDSLAYSFGTEIPTYVQALAAGMIEGGREVVSQWKVLFSALVKFIGALFDAWYQQQAARIRTIVTAAHQAASGSPLLAIRTLSNGTAAADAKAASQVVSAGKAFVDDVAPAVSKIGEKIGAAMGNVIGSMPQFKQSQQTTNALDAARNIWNQLTAAREQKDGARDRRDLLGKFVKTFRINELGEMAAKIDPQKLPAQIGAMAGGLMNQIFGFVGGAAIGGAPAAAAAEKKNRKAEFVGLAEMNKRIQGMLGENDDKKIAKQQLGAAKAGAAAAQQGAKAGNLVANGVKELIGVVKNLNLGFGT